MSVKVSGMVWDARLERDKKFVALAYADHADHEGENVHPGRKLMAKKTGYTERRIQAITQDLLSEGILVPDGQHKDQRRVFKFDLQKLRELGGEIISPGRNNQHEGGEKNDRKGEKKRATPIRDEPSREPSVETSGADADLFGGCKEFPDDPELQKLWDDWVKHRKEKRHALTDTSRKQQLAKLIEWGGGRAKAALVHSMFNGYTGLFEPNGSDSRHEAKTERKTITKDNAI